MHKKKLKKIQINNTTFRLDQHYQLVVDLVSPEFEKPAYIMDQLFGRDDKVVKILVEAVLEDDYTNDIAFTYFVSMVLQNYGEFDRAGKIITHMFQNNKSDLLAKCAYANHLIFHNKFDEIPAVFNHTFELDKITSERELPFITFIHFVEIACTYYMVKKDHRNFLKYAFYLVEAAPEHEVTKRLLENLTQATGKA